MFWVWGLTTRLSCLTRKFDVFENYDACTHEVSFGLHDDDQEVRKEGR